MTTKLLERVPAACPYNLARVYFHERFNDIADGKPSLTFVLHGAGMAKAVIATFASGSDPMHFDEPWSIEWRPENGGPFPTFRGSLTVRADEDYSTSILELEGGYEPPLGVAGAAFDHVAGARIASQTAQFLLAELAAELEERYRRDERAKSERRG